MPIPAMLKVSGAAVMFTFLRKSECALSICSQPYVSNFFFSSLEDEDDTHTLADEASLQPMICKHVVAE